MVTLRKGSVISAGFHVHEGMLIKWQFCLSTLREGVLFSGQDLVLKAILQMMNMISHGVRAQCSVTKNEGVTSTLEIAFKF